MATMELDKTGDNPPSLIQSALSAFQINSDLQAISRIEDSLSQISKVRDKHIEESRAILRGRTIIHEIRANGVALSRKLELSKSTLDSSANSPSRANHAGEMIKLDREKFSLAKNINELESGSHALESTLERLKEELENIDDEEGENKENENTDDATLLRLKVYRGLGIDLVEDESGGYSKAVVRNSKKKDVHVVNIESKYSRFFYANYLWDLL